MSGLRAVVFDLDGTLIDSAPALQAALNEMLAALGRPPVTLAQTKSFIGRGVVRLVERALAATGGGEEPGAVALFMTAYAAAAPAPPFPGVAPALAALRAEGLRLGVCTNKPQAPAERAVADAGFDGLVDAVAGAQPGVALKPDPAPLRLCVQALGGGPALFVGDSETDAETAVAADAPFALFTLGYRQAPAETLPAVWRFDDWAALPAFVGRLRGAA